MLDSVFKVGKHGLETMARNGEALSHVTLLTNSLQTGNFKLWLNYQHFYQQCSDGPCVLEDGLITIHEDIKSSERLALWLKLFLNYRCWCRGEKSTGSIRER